MLSHYREKTLSTFSIVAPVQEKNIFIASCSFCPQFVSLFRYGVSHCRGQMHSSIVWQSHLLYWELWQSSDWSIQKIFPCYQLIWVMCANFSMRLLQRKRSVGISIHNALFGLLTWGNYSLLAMPSLLPAKVFPCLVTNVYQWLVHVHPNHSIAYKLSRGYTQQSQQLVDVDKHILLPALLCHQDTVWKPLPSLISVLLERTSWASGLGICWR